MAKWSGDIGFYETVETEPGLYESQVITQHYRGDVNTLRWRHTSTDTINDNINISTQISIIANPYIYSNCYNIAYVEYLGHKWKVSEVEPRLPRLILTLGGDYNGQ